MTKGWVGVWKGPKKDDVIYEQPLTLQAIRVKLKVRRPKLDTEVTLKPNHKLFGGTY